MGLADVLARGQRHGASPSLSRTRLQDIRQRAHTKFNGGRREWEHERLCMARHAMPRPRTHRPETLPKFARDNPSP